MSKEPRGQSYRISRSLSPYHPPIPGGTRGIPHSPHSQRTVWKAQRGCFSKLSPNLRIRSRRSRYVSPAGPFILVLCLPLGLHGPPPQPSEAAALAASLSSKPERAPFISRRVRPPLRAPRVLIGCLETVAPPLASDPALPLAPIPAPSPLPASRRTQLGEGRHAEVRCAGRALRWTNAGKR